MGDSERAARVAWVKLGKVWWPGQVLNEDELTDQMKSEVASLLSRKASVKPDQIHVVKFLNEDEYEIAHNANQILLDVDEEKKHDLVKRAISSMKSPLLAENRSKFKADVLQAERLLNPSADLTDLTKLLDGEVLEKKPVGVSKYADIFPTSKPEKPSPVTPSSAKGKAGSIKFSFPSSRIISKASSKPPSKISPLPSDPSKKFQCGKCAFSADRVNVITAHMKYCKPIPSPQQKRVTATASSSPPTPTTSTPAVSPKKAAAPVPTPATPATSSPPPRKPGRPPRKSVAPVTPTVVPSPQKITTTPVSVPAPVTPAKKRGRGRRSKKDKQLSDKQKAEILQDWNDSSSEENDSDDELAPLMPPTKPPELFLFGSEKNKKRKADAIEEKVDTGANDGATTSTVATNEDEPPVLKKPRTDKELSDAFDSLLKTTKMELPTWEDKEGKEETEDEDDDKMEVEGEPQLSDIEEDANILMKKGDAMEDTEVAPILEKESTQKNDEAVDSNEKEPEPVQATPSITTRKTAEQKKKVTSSKRPEEKRPEITTRRSTRSRGDATIKDNKQVEKDKEQDSISVSTETPVPSVASSVESTEEVPVKKGSLRKAQSTKDESKVAPVDTSNAENMKDDDKVEDNTEETKPIPSTKKNEEKIEEITPPEPKKVEAVPEENTSSAPPKSVSSEAILHAASEDKIVPPPEPVEDTKKFEAKKSTPPSPTKASAQPIPIPIPKTVPVAAASPTKTNTASVATVKATTVCSPVPVPGTVPASASSPSIPKAAPTTTLSPPVQKAAPAPAISSSESVPKVVPVAASSSPVPKVAPTTAVPPPLLKTAVTPPSTVTSSAVAKPFVETTTTVQPPPPPVITASKSAPKLLSPQKKADEIKVAASANTMTSPLKVAPAGSPPKALNQQPQKKPTAAVRPLVDTKEVPLPSMKDGKGTPTTVTVTAPPKGSPKEQPQSQTSAGQTIVTQQQQGNGEESGKKSPNLVAQRVVHLVPVENQDGTITYMLLSLENGNENPNVLDQGVDQSNSVLRVDKVEPMNQGAPPNIPMNPNEVEGIFLDKNVENANQLVSALAQGTQAGAQTTVTTTTSMMDATTAYVTLAMDAMGDAGVGVAASSSDALAAAGLLQQSIVLPESATTVQDGSGETQQVFYMTEDGSILDPQSLGLTLEQLQQLLNQ